jgi:flagellar motor protein MotB
VLGTLACTFLPQVRRTRVCARSRISALARRTLPAALLCIVSGCDGRHLETRGAEASSTTCIGVSLDCYVMTFFDRGSSALTSQTLNTLSSFLASCRKLGQGTIFVTGHADSTGASEDLAVSRARAESVRTHLIARGIPADSLKIEAYGATKPLVSPTDRRPVLAEPDHAQNRRVDVQLR